MALSRSFKEIEFGIAIIYGKESYMQKKFTSGSGFSDGVFDFSIR